MNRRNVTTKPKKDFNAHEDFFTLVVVGFVLGAAMEILGMENLEDDPCQQILPPDVWLHDKCERRDILTSVAGVIVNEYVDLSMFHHKEKLPSDRIHGYAKELLTLGLFYLEYSDAIREGDGLRVLRCWRYLFLLFKASNRTNYTIEAFNFLAQHAFLLPPRLADQLLWSRFINTHGVPGKNIPCDLHMEHLNRVLKTAIQHLGANKTEKAVVRVGKCIAPLSDTLSQYDHIHTISETSGYHPWASSEKDLKHILTELQRLSPFDDTPGRYHKSFSQLGKGLMNTLKREELDVWMKEHWKRLLGKLL